jgi:glycosyltransferase involved in cell wall biosynthesis
MRLLLDARWIREGRTGVGIYCEQMVKELVSLHKDTTLITHAVNRPFVKDILAPKIEIDADLIDHPRSDLFEQWGLVRLAESEKFTHFVSFEGRVPFFKGRLKTFSLIHDLASLRVRGSHRTAYTHYLKWCLWNSSRSASVVLVVSEAIKRQFMEAYPKTACPVQVIYNGPTPWPEGNIQVDRDIGMGIGQSFFLAVGMANPRKNLNALAKAFAQYREQGGRHQLVVTGEKKQVEDVCGAALASGIHLVGYISDVELKRLYQNCSGLVYPSLDEGFGIPLIDAAAWKKPIACSDIEVFHEVLGPYPIYFTPTDIQSMVHALFHLEQVKLEMLPKLPRKYGWRESAEQLMKVLRAASDSD